MKHGNTKLMIGLISIMTLMNAEPSLGQSNESWQDRIIYLAMVDRIENGSRDNDLIYGESACNNAKDPHAFQGGDLKGLQERLPDLANLGTNALWLTPLYKGVPSKEGQNCGYSGYWPAFEIPYALELDPRFGTANDFDSMLSDARSLGIRTILDMVVNHAGYDAPLVSQHPDWFHEPGNCATLGSPEIFCPLAGLPDFNHRNPDAASYLVELHQAWTERFDISGIRMDTVKHVEPWFFRDWINGVREKRSDLFVFGELLDEGSYSEFQKYLDAEFEGLFNFPLRRALIDTFAKGASVDVTASRVREMLGLFGQEQSRWLVTLLDNHDVPRFTEEFPKHLAPERVHERYKLALTALLTLPGIPQITFGNEVGMYGGADPDNRRMMPQWAFSPEFLEPDHPGFVTKPGQIWKHLQRLIEIRKGEPALTRGDYDEIWRQTDPKSPNVWAFVRHLHLKRDPEHAHSSESLLVVVNIGDAGSGKIWLPLRGHFTEGRILRSIPLEHEAQTGKLTPDSRAFLVRNGEIEIELNERSAMILADGEQLP